MQKAEGGTKPTVAVGRWKSVDVLYQYPPDVGLRR